MKELINKLAEILNRKPINIKDIDPSFRYPDVYTDFTPDLIDKVDESDQQYIFTFKNKFKISIQILSADIFRLRYAPKGIFIRDFSYAIDPAYRPSKTEVGFTDEKSYYQIETATLVCKITKEKGLIHFYDKAGQVICEDENGFSARETIMEGWTELKVNKKIQADEAFFGLGDKASELNLRGKKFENWCTDSFAYHKELDPLYRAIPFYFALHAGRGYGIFMDNSFRSHFDFDSKDDQQASFSADGGEMNYYFINGPKLIDVVTRYTDLTGRPELPPMWALGFHQCRWSYFPEDRVKTVAQKFRDLKIPCDAIYLDIDYMDGYRCFTWNKEYFPKPKKMIRELKEDGFETVVMIDPGIKVDDDYEVYTDGVKNNVFCRRINGDEMNGPVWPPNCAWPDFTSPRIRNWWGPLYKELYVDQGVSGFWNDMNEPAVFGVDSKTFPEGVWHDYDGQGGNHAKAHNIYGMNMTRATFDGLKKLNPEKRPFLVARATFSGGQRFASVWTGDNVASWEHIDVANRQCQRLSASGFSFVGSDIGGFAGEPTGEMMVRWLQIGIFHPFYRVHSIGNNTDGSAATDDSVNEIPPENNRMDQEPWAFGEEYTNQAREAISLRYQLLPYIYTYFWKYTKDGDPMIRSMVLMHQDIPAAAKLENEFYFGDHLLVIPVTKSGTNKIKGFLPKGIWYDLTTCKEYKGKDKNKKIKVSANRIPILVKAGCIIPMHPVRQHTKEKVSRMYLSYYYGSGEFNSYYYEDTGEGYGYENGDFLLSKIKVESNEKGITISRNAEGSYEPEYRYTELKLHQLPFEIMDVKVDGKPFEFMDKEEGKLKWVSVIIPPSFKSISILPK